MAKDQETMDEYEPGAPSEGFLDGVPDDLSESEASAEERSEAPENGVPEQSRSEAEDEPQENPYADEEKKTDPIVENEILQAERALLPEEQLRRMGEPPVVPAEPNGLKSWLHSLFNWFDDEFAERERMQRELKAYLEKKADLQYQVDMARRARDPRTQERARWREARNAEIGEELDSDELRLQQAARDYAPVVGQKLDQLYSEMEKNTDGSIARGRLVSIEDTCIETLLNNEFFSIPAEKRPLNEKGDPMDLGGYQKAFGEKRTNEMIAEALLSGKRVSYLPVNPENGGVTAEEMRFLPKPEAKEFPDMAQEKLDRLTEYARRAHPSKLTETERHRRAVRNAELLKKVNYFDTMEVNSVFSAPVKRSFFGEWEKEKKMKAEQISTDAVSTITRGGLSSLAVARMVCDGYPIEKVLDPTCLLKEKNDIGREVLTHVQKNDYAWVARVNLAGRERLGDDLTKRTNKTDFNDTASLYCESNRFAYQEAMIMFDLSQDYNMNDRVKAEGNAWFAAKGKTKESAAKYKEDFERKTMYYPTLFSSAYNEKHNYALAAAGLGDTYAWHNGIGGTFSRKLITERRKAGPKAPIHTLFTLNDVIVASSTSILQGTSKEARREFFGKLTGDLIREKADKMETGEYWKDYVLSFQKGESPMPQMSPVQPVKKQTVPVKIRQVSEK